MESFGARTFTNSLINCSYCSALSKPKRYLFTISLYSLGTSVKGTSSPKAFLSSPFSRGILLLPTSL